MTNQSSTTLPSRLVVPAIIVAAAILRLSFLSHWPPVQADEGLWTNSTKNFLLFGNWFMDGRKHLFLSPLFHVLSLASFSVLGPSIAHARLISALSGVAATWLLYATIKRMTHRQDVATATMALFACSEWVIFNARTALIEPLQLTLVLLVVYLITHETRAAYLGAGLSFGLLLLAKINAGFLLLVLLSWLAWEAMRHRMSGREALYRASLITGASMLLAGLVYWRLYEWQPQRFVAAFRFELNGVHFESMSHPIVRVARFAFDPVEASRSVIALCREAPFTFVLCLMGLAVWFEERAEGSELFVLWLVIGGGFTLLQMYQPLRYFVLISPPLFYFAGLSLAWMARRSRVGVLVLGLALVFDVSYTGMNWVANPATVLPTVKAWVQRHVPQSARIVSAGYLATDLKNRTYAYYYILTDTAHMADSLRAYKINYVIYDSSEWPRAFRSALDAHYRRVHTFPFGAVYQVSPLPDDAGVPPRPRGSPKN